jgi:signal peptidase II
MRRSNWALFWPVLLVVLVLDLITKALAVRHLAPRGFGYEVVGQWVQLRLVYNPGAAFGLSLGEHSRILFSVLTFVALAILAQLARHTARGDVPRILALSLVCAGAVGNLVDRLRSPLGVVDFIDVGIGSLRWPTFNVADMAVTTGAILLAVVLWREDQALAAAALRDEREGDRRAPADPAAVDDLPQDGASAFPR